VAALFWFNNKQNTVY